MIWRCPKLTRYWTEVTQTISALAQTPIPSTPLVYLLGVINTEMYPKVIYIMLTTILYLARKLIARFWLASADPTRAQWMLTLFSSGNSWHIDT